MAWDMSEIEWWAACFSINDNQDQPKIKNIPQKITVEQSIADTKKVLGHG